MNCPRCGKSIEEHEAEPCIDAWVQDTLGFEVFGPVPRYALDLDLAIGQMLNLKTDEKRRDFDWAVMAELGIVNPDGFTSDECPSPFEVLSLGPLAIIKAFLKAKIGETE